VDWDDGTVTRYTLLQDPDAPAFPAPTPPTAASLGLAPQAQRLTRALLGILLGAAALSLSLSLGHDGLAGATGQRRQRPERATPRLPRGTVLGRDALDAPLTVAPGEVNSCVSTSKGSKTTLQPPRRRCADGRTARIAS